MSQSNRVELERKREREHRETHQHIFKCTNTLLHSGHEYAQESSTIICYKYYIVLFKERVITATFWPNRKIFIFCILTWAPH